MKQKIYYAMAALLVMLTLVGTAMAGYGNGTGYMDTDNDGVCDNFVDEDGDGINDDRNFIDADNDGVCDSFVDEDGDGLNDNRKGYGQGNGNGNMHRHGGNGGQYGMNH
ncbi:MAG: hypothetical protein U9N13_00235 [Euryarchaeota archaeon]|nr:hypothetical protein [Euryarchaeota archaeon]